MVPKSTAWNQAYEWDNYRLACSLMNSRKGDAASVLDPFDVEDGWFVLELVAFQVLPAHGLADPTAAAVEDTIDRLRLNDEECCERARGVRGGVLERVHPVRLRAETCALRRERATPPEQAPRA